MIYLLLFFCSIFFSLAVTPALIKRAWTWGLLDRPDTRKTHKEPMPIVGGLVLFPLVAAGFSIAFAGTDDLPFLLTATAAIFLLGVVDDLKGTHFSIKFLIQTAAALLVIQSGVLFDLNRISILGGFDVHFGRPVSIMVTLVWIVGITNAINLIDGMDGLASGLCLNAFVGIGAVALLTGKSGLALICIILAGGTLGFLRYNIDPARTYLGDSGSILLGFTLAVISIMQSAKTSTFLVLVVPAMLLAIPMADTTLVFLRRTAGGANPFKPDRRHLHHKLLDLNFSVKQTLGIFYSFSTLLGVMALWLLRSNNAQILALALVLLITVITVVKAMQVYNFHDLVNRANSRIRAVARKAVSSRCSGEERPARNLILLTVFSALNMVLVSRETLFSGIFMTAVSGLFVLGVMDFILNINEAKPRYEIQHTTIFLSIVLNQVLIFTLLPVGYIDSPRLAAAGFLTLTIIGVFLFLTGAFATFLQDPVEIIGLFIALVIIELMKHFLGTSGLLPFSMAVFNALILYTISKVYLTGYRVRTRFVTAGMAIFIAALVGMVWIR